MKNKYVQSIINNRKLEDSIKFRSTLITSVNQSYDQEMQYFQKTGLGSVNNRGVFYIKLLK